MRLCGLDYNYFKKATLQLLLEGTAIRYNFIIVLDQIYDKLTTLCC